MIGRPANFFHVVNNLAGWHFSHRPHYNRVWLAETGELTLPEKQSLSAFTEVAREFPYGDKWLGRPFILADSEAEAWAGAGRLVGKRRARRLRRAFAALEARFSRLWERDLPRLKARAEELDPLLRAETMDRAAAALQTYLATSFPYLIIHLQISRGANSVAGGGNEAPGHITLECLETADLWSAVETVLHEAAHEMEKTRFCPEILALNERYGLDRLKGEAGWSALNLIWEALTGALVPGGCLSPLLGREPDDSMALAEKAREHGDGRMAGLYELTARLSPLVDAYLRAGRAVDRDLMEQAYTIFARTRPALR